MILLYFLLVISKQVLLRYLCHQAAACFRTQKQKSTVLELMQESCLPQLFLQCAACLYTDKQPCLATSVGHSSFRCRAVAVNCQQQQHNWIPRLRQPCSADDAMLYIQSMWGMQDLNAQFEGSLKKLLCRKLRPHVDEAILISIDKLGADVRVRVGSDYSVERIGWQKVHLPCLWH